MPGIGMRTATIAVVERQPSLESTHGGGGGGGEGGEVVSTISGVIVKQVREREKQDVGEERERNEAAAGQSEPFSVSTHLLG